MPVQTSYEDLIPVDEPTAVEGRLYYDSSEKKLKYYDGSQWITLGVLGYTGFDNDGGGAWTKYINIPITTSPSEYAQYKIEIDSTNVTVYSADGTQKAQGAVASDFWANVKSDGTDIRAFDEAKSQLYFYIENFDYTNKQATIWVKLEAGSTELNIAYGNPSATKSDYEDGEQVFEFFDDFDGTSLDTSKWTTIASDGTLSVSDGWLSIAPDFTHRYVIGSIQSFQEPAAIYAKIDYDASGEFYFDTGVSDDVSTYPPPNWVRCILTDNEGSASLKYVQSGTSQDSSSATLVTSGIHAVVLRVYTNSADAKIDDTQLGPITKPNLSEVHVELYAGRWSDGVGTAKWDYVFVAKLTDPADFGTPQILEF